MCLLYIKFNYILTLFLDPDINTLYLNENFRQIYKKKLRGMVEQHKLILR